MRSTDAPRTLPVLTGARHITYVPSALEQPKNTFALPATDSFEMNDSFPYARNAPFLNSIMGDPRDVNEGIRLTWSNVLNVGTMSWRFARISETPNFEVG